ncbi:MAG TPA: hypothetical protein VK906_11520 [Egicoccus sp.]|nr:hypothetical protein [Egicoccus sp.]HSK23801.1 hypothetical protein [Egicoccus sp.]
MCHPTTCRACSKTTWAGCGQHAQQVMARVPRDRQCSCTEAERAAAKGNGLMARLLGR